MSSGVDLSGSLTCGDVLVAEHELLGHPPAHADVHLRQQLRARLAPAVVLREHGHLRGQRPGHITISIQPGLYAHAQSTHSQPCVHNALHSRVIFKQFVEGYFVTWTRIPAAVLNMADSLGTYMAQGGAPWHDGGFIDGHRVFGVVRDDGVSGFMVRRDGLVFFVDLHAPAFWACEWGRGKKHRMSGGPLSATNSFAQSSDPIHFLLRITGSY